MARRKGTPKTGGRRAGTLNKATEAVRTVAQRHSASAIATLKEIMTDLEAPPQYRIAAANSILDRAHGKPVASVEQRVDLTAQHASEDEPLTPEQMEEELEKRGLSWLALEE